MILIIYLEETLLLGSIQFYSFCIINNLFLFLHHSCHRGSGTCGEYGFRLHQCDSPMDLLSKALDFVKASQPDVIVFTGDNARHATGMKCFIFMQSALIPLINYISKDDAVQPRTLDEIIQTNKLITDSLRASFKGDLIMSIGNNDVHPHDNLDPPPNDMLTALAGAYSSYFKTAAEKSLFLNGGYYSRVIGKTKIINLNTQYFFLRIL